MHSESSLEIILTLPEFVSPYLSMFFKYLLCSDHNRFTKPGRFSKNDPGGHCIEYVPIEHTFYASVDCIVEKKPKT